MHVESFKGRSVVRGVCRLLISFAAVVMMTALPLLGCGGGGPSALLKSPSKKATPVISEAQKMSPEDLLFEEAIDQLRVSPDGGHVAWTRVTYTPDSSDPKTDIFLTSTGDLSTVQLTSGLSVSNLEWSPDGSRLAFMSSTSTPGSSSEEAVNQVLVIPAAGGQALEVTQAPDGIMDYDWRGPDKLVYSAVDAERTRETDQPVNAEDDTIHASEVSTDRCNLYEVSAAGGQPTTLFKADDMIVSVAVSPDGSHAFAIRTRDKQGSVGREYYQNVPFTNHLIDLTSGKEKKVLAGVRQVSDFEWSPDSRTLYVVDDYSTSKQMLAYIARLWAYDVPSGEAKLVNLDWDRALDITSSNIRPTRQGFIANLANGFNPKVAIYTRQGGNWKRSLLKGTHQGNMFSFDRSADCRTVAYYYSTGSKPPQGYIASLTGDNITGERQFTSINRNLEGKSPAVTEIITWTGAFGDTVEGLLYYPSGYQRGKRYPLVVSLHGGPFGPEEDQWIARYRRWTDPRQLFAQKGAFVLVPNFHGSGNYGYEFDNALEGDYYLQTQDIESGIDRLIELGMADENRLGTMGWSNGGMISNALIATDQRFKAASCGAGGAEWVSLWGPSAYGDHSVEYFFGADPLSDPSLFKEPENAPFYNAGKVRTPVIMFGGTEDEAVPVGMTWITYRGIQKHTKTPVELYLFPDEPHIIAQPAHQLRKLVEEQKWFDRYLFQPDN
jgi:dipeptidyl aminopeptidase/acylaminoacyl peptidase